MSRVSSVLILLALVSYQVSCQSGRDDSPNILFIAIDDLRPELGVYGNKVIHTPNLDRLGQQGFLFSNHFVQVPTCGASRHALLTGKWPRSRVDLSNNAIVENISNDSIPDQPESFIHKFRMEGYYTVGIGKISHSADGRVYGYTDPVSDQLELPNSWDERLFDTGKWGTGWNAFFGYANGENRQSMNNEVPPFEMGNVDDDGYPDGLSANLALLKLDELKKANKKFFLGVGFFKPHLPFTSPKKYWDMYDGVEIPTAPFTAIPEGVSRQSLHNSGEFNSYRVGERAGLDTVLSPDYAKTLNQAYFASVSYIDEQVGKLLRKLDTLGLADNTVVVIWGDHGWHLGDHRVWGKHTLFDRSLRSTLIIRDPRKKGRRVEQVVSSVDLYPTLMELAGISRQDKTDGNSMVTMMENIDVAWKNQAYSYFRNGISMRTREYRITRYYRRDSVAIELFDHREETEEVRNIANLKPEVVDRLLLLLEEGNTGLYTANQ